ncbi:MAG TPA: hypothetical protein VF767_09445, partial [Bryobacteraceae bacterium]
MRKQKTKPDRRPEVAAPKTTARAGVLKPWHYALALGAALVVALLAYEPALGGGFVFDDLYLPFTYQEFVNASFWSWIAGVRPLLMFSFWVNHKLSGMEPYSYHLINVLLHF